MTTTFSPQDYKVALLAGGKSKEREVSLASGAGSKKALEEAGFPVTQLDPAKKEDLISLIENDYDIAFLCLHGKYGEDGTMQGFLEIAGIPYTGSNVWGSALAMDKCKAKIFYERAGIKTPRSMTIAKADFSDSTADEIMTEIGCPCVVKPATEGSALGVYIVNNEDELKKALQEVFELDKQILVETYVKGKELTVAVVGNDDPDVYPIIEIVPQNEFYDYESKYAPGGSVHICPAQIEDSIAKKIQEAAVQAHLVLGCSGVSRSDFLLEDNGDFWILETNTLPGMTETSLLPDAGRAAGLSFPELCVKLVQLALED